jgi:ATP-dependent DNA ligase
MKARAVKSFPIGKEWMYEPKWDGFRCLVFRDDENVFLQSRTGKNLTGAFPEIVAAFRALSLKRFVLDGELAMPTKNGFSFDGLVNRLRIGSARLAMEVRDSPAIYIVFDMLANSENLLGSPFRVRRKTLERFFENWVPRSPPLYLSASTDDLREVEKWAGHIGQQLDGIIAKRVDAPYRPGDDHSTVKIKNYRSADCVVGGFRDHVIGSARNELLLGLYDQNGHLQYVSSVGINAKQKQQVGMLRPKKTTTFYGRQPGEKSHWSGEAVGPWKPVALTKVVEVRYDHFGDGRFRHGCTFLRVREDKLPKDCLLEQVVEPAAIQDISAFIEAGLATAGIRMPTRNLKLAGGSNFYKHR